MLLGKRFKLTRQTTGLELLHGTVRVMSIPANSIIKVMSGPNAQGALSHDKGFVYVLWEDRTVALFAVDVEERGIEIKEPDGGHQHRKSETA